MNTIISNRIQPSQRCSCLQKFEVFVEIIEIFGVVSALYISPKLLVDRNDSSLSCSNSMNNATGNTILSSYDPSMYEKDIYRRIFAHVNRKYTSRQRVEHPRFRPHDAFSRADNKPLYFQCKKAPSKTQNRRAFRENQIILEDDACGKAVVVEKFSNPLSPQLGCFSRVSNVEAIDWFLSNVA